MLTEVSIKNLEDYITTQELICNIRGKMVWDAVGKTRSLFVKAITQVAWNNMG